MKWVKGTKPDFDLIFFLLVDIFFTVSNRDTTIMSMDAVALSLLLQMNMCLSTILNLISNLL